MPEKSELVLQERNRVLQREPMAFSTKVRTTDSLEATFHGLAAACVEAGNQT